MQRSEIVIALAIAAVFAPALWSLAQVWSSVEHYSHGFLIPVAILWGYALISLLRRPDLSVGPKLLWLLAILVLPILGALVYFMLRPAPQEQARRAQAHELLPRIDVVTVLQGERAGSRDALDIREQKAGRR